MDIVFSQHNYVQVVGYNHVSDNNYILAQGTEKNILDQNVVIYFIATDYRFFKPFQTEMEGVYTAGRPVWHLPHNRFHNCHISLFSIKVIFFFIENQ